MTPVKQQPINTSMERYVLLLTLLYQCVIPCRTTSVSPHCLCPDPLCSCIWGITLWYCYPLALSPFLAAPTCFFFSVPCCLPSAVHACCLCIRYRSLSHIVVCAAFSN